MFQKKKSYLFIALSVLILCLSLIGIYRNRQINSEKKYTELVSLGEKYLEDLNYEAAIAAFMDALEIDPKQTDAYIGLSKAYRSLGNTEKAMYVLQEGYAQTGVQKLLIMAEDILPDEISESDHRAEIKEEKAPLSEEQETSENDFATQEETESEVIPEQLAEPSKEQVNSFLSIIYETGIREYNFQTCDMSEWMDFAWMFEMLYGEYGLIEEEVEGEYYFTLEWNRANQIVSEYFGAELPKESIGSDLYKDGKYYSQRGEWGELGMSLVLENDINLVNPEQNKYEVTFDIAYVWPENFQTGKLNPLEDWDTYYSYDMEQLKNDEFCEVLGYGDAIITQNEGNIVLSEFHAYEGRKSPLTEDEAYEIVKKYWESFHDSMPQNVEYEGITEYGHCFWGYYLANDHAATNFRIAVDAQTGRLYDFIRDEYIN